MPIFIAVAAVIGLLLIGLSWAIPAHADRLHRAGSTCVALALVLATGAVLVD